MIVLVTDDGKYINHHHKDILTQAKHIAGSQDVVLVERFVKDDERRIYNAIYTEGKDGPTFVKRFNVVFSVFLLGIPQSEAKSEP